MRSFVIVSFAVCLGACSKRSPVPRDLAFSREAAGCGDVFLYRGNAKGDAFVTVSAPRAPLGLAMSGARELDLASPPPGLAVALDVYSSGSEAGYCTDVPPPDKRHVTWLAESGHATVTLANDPTATRGSPTYLASVTLRDVVFRSPHGETLTVPSLVFANVRVGWYAG